MFVVVAKCLIPKGYNGLTLYPFVLLRDKQDKANAVLINHESIHIRQQLQLLVLPFFIWYGIEYVIRLLHYKNKREAYRNISFEREAYGNETNMQYLEEMPFWGFLNYLKK